MPVHPAHHVRNTMRGPELTRLGTPQRGSELSSLRLRDGVLDEVGEFGLGDGGYLDGLDGHDLVLVQRQRVPDVHLRLHVHPKLGRCAD